MKTITQLIIDKLNEIDLEGGLDLLARGIVEEHMRKDEIRWRRNDPLATPHGKDPRIRIQSERLKDSVLGDFESTETRTPNSITRSISVPYAFTNEGKYPYIQRALEDEDLVNEIKDFLENSI